MVLLVTPRYNNALAGVEEFSSVPEGEPLPTGTEPGVKCPSSCPRRLAGAAVIAHCCSESVLVAYEGLTCKAVQGAPDP